MKILALELSTSRGSLAWLDGEIEFTREWPNDRKNSATFFDNLQAVRRKFGAPETITVGLGPGSYAGTRIAISAAIGIQLSCDARLIGYPSICAMECDAQEYCVIGDARRKSFFFARILKNEVIEGPTLFSELELKARLESLDPATPVFSSELLPQFHRPVIGVSLGSDSGQTCEGVPTKLLSATAGTNLFARTTHHHAEMKETYRCWAEIDRAALRHNAKVVRDRIGSAEMLAVVKANAYGHGLVGVAEALADDAQLFGVANLEEALTLRESLPHPIMILGPATPEERPIIAEHGFIPTISSLEEAQAFDRLKAVSVNFKIDTGMGRMGVVQNEAREVFQRVAAMANVEIHSISTHMPVSNEDAEYTRDQLVRFQRIVDQIRAEVPGNYKAHVLQSAGTLAFNQQTHEIVRAGIMLYGISPLPEFRELLKPVMTWKTRICLVRDVPKGSSISYGRTFIAPQNMRVATLSAGYADGYPWHLSNRGAGVLVRGKRCPLLGRVTMDLMVIDVSGLDDVQVGDDVVLMGRDGSEEIPCVELGEKAGTITWEIVTRIGARVRRVYL